MKKEEYLQSVGKRLSNYTYRERLLEELSDHIDDAGEHNLNLLGSSKDMKNTVKTIYGGTRAWIFVAMFVGMFVPSLLALPFLDDMTTYVGENEFLINLMPIMVFDFLLAQLIILVLAGMYLHQKRAVSRKYVAINVFGIAMIARITSTIIFLAFSGGIGKYGEGVVELALLGLGSVTFGAIISAVIAFAFAGLRFSVKKA